MIGMLSGTVKGRCVVVNGVGYVVSTPTPLTEGEEVELLVTTVVREDDISLYAFTNPVDQELFGILRKATGVGPALALALLRDVGAAQVIGAVTSGEHKLLSRAAGVGAKKAETIYLAVRGKLPDTLVQAAASPEESSELRELVDTLEGLGFSPEQSRSAAEAAIGSVGPGEEAELLGAALSHLRRAG